MPDVSTQDGLLARAKSTLTIDREADLGVSHDANVWAVHDLD